MKRLWLTILVVALYALHQDVWLWRAARPLAFGFLPPGITYHVGYTLAIAALMWLLVKLAWPTHLEDPDVDDPPQSAIRNLQSGGAR